MRYTRQQTLRMTSGDWDVARLNTVRGSLRDRLCGHLVEQVGAAGQDVQAIIIDEVAMIRYRGQSYAIEVPDPNFEDRAALGKEFQRIHDKLYGFATDEPWELESLRISASLPKTTGALRPQMTAQTNASPLKSASCWFSDTGALVTPRYDRAYLPVGQSLPGPLVVEDAFSTVIVPPGATLTPDQSGHLLIDTGAAQ